MDFETALAFISGVFLLVGIVGRIEIQHLRLGTENKLARGASTIVGLILLLIALNQKTDLLRLNLPRSTQNLSALPKQSEQLDRPRGYFVVVSSTRSEPKAVVEAKKLAERGYSAEVHKTSSGFLAVVVRAKSASERSQLYERLLSDGLAANDAFLSVGQKFRGQVYPR